MRILIAILMFLFVAPSVCLCATVNEGHPRIILNSTTKATLIARCQGTGDVDLSGHYASLKACVDSLSYSAADGSGHVLAHIRSWLPLIIVAMVETGANDDAYLSTIETMIASWETTNCASDCGWDYRMSIPAIAYDWLYDKLSSGARQNVADLYQCWWAYNTGEGNSSGEWSNHSMEKIIGMVFGPLALDGDGLCNADATTYLAEGESYIDDFLAATNMSSQSSETGGLDGGWPEGDAYAGRGAGALFWNVLAWNSATDESLTSYTVSGMGQWLFHYLRNDDTFFRFNESKPVDIDGSNTFFYSQGWWIYPWMSTYSDTYLKYIWDRMYPSFDDTTLESWERVYYSLYILFYDGTTSAVAPANVDKTSFFDGFGGIYIHEAFNDDSSWCFGYHHADYKYAGHQGSQEGGFEIGRGTDGGLIIRAGAYEGGDHSGSACCGLSQDAAGSRLDVDYYSRGISGNIITVVDPDEDWPDYYNRWTINDGGQKWGGPADRGAGFRPDDIAELSTYPSFERGSIERFLSGTSCTYWRSNLTNAYALSDGSNEAVSNSSKMVFYYREFVQSGDFFVLIDRVESDNSSFKKRSLLHYHPEPTVSGSAGSTTNGGTPYTGSNKTITVTRGSSRAIIETVLPSTIEVYKVGGAGYEAKDTYGVAAYTDKTPYYGEPGSIADPVDEGFWRTEVSPSDSNTQDTFLQVIKVGASDITMPTVNSLSGTGYVGAHIEDSTENVIAVFSSAYSDTDNTGVTYTVTPTTDSRHIVSGLTQSTTYNVNGSGSYASGTAGAIEFTDTATSETEYVIASGSGSGGGSATCSGSGSVTCSGSGSVTFQ